MLLQVQPAHRALPATIHRPRRMTVSDMVNIAKFCKLTLNCNARQASNASQLVVVANEQVSTHHQTLPVKSIQVGQVGVVIQHKVTANGYDAIEPFKAGQASAAA